MPNEDNVKWLTARRYTIYDQVLRLHAQILAQGGETQAQRQCTVQELRRAV